MVLSESGSVYECLQSSESNCEKDQSLALQYSHNKGLPFFDDYGYKWRFVWHLTREIREQYMDIGESDKFVPRDPYMPVSYNLYDSRSLLYKNQQEYGISPDAVINYTKCNKIRIKIILRSDANVRNYNQLSLIDSPLDINGNHYTISAINKNMYNASIYKGCLIYACNRSTIKRHKHQNEEIKIILGF